MSAQKWLTLIERAKKEDSKWITRAKKIIKRYRDEREYSTTSKFNILWSNIQTTLPALYGKTPRAQVERRYKDQDQVGRTASVILERCLQYEIDHYGCFDEALRLATLDKLLPGRGTAWVRFEQGQGQSETGPYEYEATKEDYVYWEDFLNSPARTWEEVSWVARRVYMTRNEVVERFGEKFKAVPLTQEPIGLDEMQRNGEDVSGLMRAQVWEIWDKPSKKVIWVAEGYGTAVLDEKDDPLGLDKFWPCPKPLYSTQTSDTLIPVPDFSQYQDQAKEIDILTARIALLSKAVKVVGVYDASQEAIGRMLSEGVDNSMIPVDSWAAFSEKGGLKGQVDWLPLEQVIKALNECYIARENAKQVIYEITGLSDIIRGASVASETATAQQIKSQYASLRLKRAQQEVARFATEILQIKAQMMGDLYAPETLMMMSGIKGTQDAQYAEAAIQLIKSEPARSFRVEVAADSMVEMDEAAEKESRLEFLTAAGTFMEKALPVATQVPELGPLMGEMLMFGVRSFKGGRQMEAAFEQAMAQLTAPKEPKPQPPTPEEVKAQADMQLEQMRQQGEAAKLQAGQATEQAKLQASADIEQIKQRAETEREQLRMAHEREMEALRQQAETERAEMKIRADSETKLQIAGMNAAAAEKPAANINLDTDGKLGEISESITAMVQQSTEAMTQGAQALAEVAEKLSRPKKRVLRKGPDGTKYSEEID